MSETASGPSVNPADVARFSAVAAEWWDPKGKFAPLHKFNPIRLAFIREEALRRFSRDHEAARPFENLRLLDIGCGGGLLSEPMTRLGFAVTGVDASARNIGVASAHADSLGFKIDYRCSTAESLLEIGEPLFDVILNMEVIEHVADPKAYLIDCARLLKPGGLMIVATLNRTLKALAFAKIGAEYVLGWLPRGAHDWSKFLKPEQVRGFLDGQPVAVEGPFGVAYDPLGDRWSQSSDCSINYMMTVVRNG
jgi:2-polyprenyl-6-hydroxyphenyl methylase/3-demethylubiquinone-9 3-methyltransferase